MSELLSFVTSVRDAIAQSKDFVLTVAALIGMYVGVVGLRTWRDKLVGERDYELARKLLHSTYRYRDAILAARNWHYSAAEVNEAKQAAKGEDTEEAFLESVYHGRLRVVAEARRQFEAQLDEAEVLWETKPTATILPLAKLENELIRAVQLYLTIEWSKTHGHETIRADYEQQFAQYDGVLLTSMKSPLKPESDAFGGRLTGAVNTIVAAFKPHLPRP